MERQQEQRESVGPVLHSHRSHQPPKLATVTMGDAWDDTPLPLAQQPQPIIKPRTTITDYNRSLTHSFNNLAVHSDAEPADTAQQAKEVAAVLNTGKVNIKIKKRDSSNNLNKSQSNSSIHSQHSASSAEKLAAEREAEYARVRAQIFASEAPSATNSSAAPRSNAKAMNHKSKATGHLDLLNSVVANQRRAPACAQPSGDSGDSEYRRNRAARPPVDQYPQYESRSYEQRPHDRYDDNAEYDEYGQRVRKPNVYSANDFPTLGR